MRGTRKSRQDRGGDGVILNKQHKRQVCGRRRSVECCKCIKYTPRFSHKNKTFEVNTQAAANDGL